MMRNYTKTNKVGRFFIGMTLSLFAVGILMGASISNAQTTTPNTISTATSSLTVGGAPAMTSSTIISTTTAAIIPPNLPLSICFVISKNLGMSSRDTTPNGDVTMLQKFLGIQDYLGVQPTGYFGPLTSVAVKLFQKNNNIPQTGFVGPLTRAAIKKISCDSIVTGGGKDPLPAASPITITSPQANDVWNKGQFKNIVWSAFEPQTFAAGPIPPNPSNYDISLEPYVKPCTNKICPMYMMMIKPYTIATNVPSNGIYHMSYTWLVGTTTDADRTIPFGDYRIRICATTGGICIESDKFTIAQ